MKIFWIRKVRALDIIYAHFYSMPCMRKLLNLIAIGEKREDGLRHLGTKIFDQQEPVFDFTLMNKHHLLLKPLSYSESNYLIKRGLKR